jgi:hypothetical protein
MMGKNKGSPRIYESICIMRQESFIFIYRKVEHKYKGMDKCIIAIWLKNQNEHVNFFKKN